MAVALELASCSEGGGGAGASSFGAIPNRRRILRRVCCQLRTCSSAFLKVWSESTAVIQPLLRPRTLAWGVTQPRRRPSARSGHVVGLFLSTTKDELIDCMDVFSDLFRGTLHSAGVQPNVTVGCHITIPRPASVWSQIFTLPNFCQSICTALAVPQIASDRAILSQSFSP